MITRSTLASGVVLVVATVVAYADAATSQGATLLVNVSEFKNQSGTLRCGLYSSASEFPSGRGVRATASISGKTARCRFAGIVPGTYAIAVFHDENDNGKLDKSFFGVPTEGYGVSNNHTHALSSPKWDESKFRVVGGGRKALAISLRY